MARESPHSILGIGPGASKHAIKDAFRRKVKQWHPDRNPTAFAAEQFRKIQWASEELLHKQDGKWEAAAREARAWTPAAEHIRTNTAHSTRIRAGIPSTLAVCGFAIASSMGLFVLAWRRHEVMYPRTGALRGRQISGSSVLPDDGPMPLQPAAARSK